MYVLLGALVGQLKTLLSGRKWFHRWSEVQCTQVIIYKNCLKIISISADTADNLQNLVSCCWDTPTADRPDEPALPGAPILQHIKSKPLYTQPTVVVVVVVYCLKF